MARTRPYPCCDHCVHGKRMIPNRHRRPCPRGCEPNVVTLSRSDRDVLTDALEHLWLTKPARRAAVERLTAKVGVLPVAIADA